jgi:large subunit ribosomal protein L25
MDTSTVGKLTVSLRTTAGHKGASRGLRAKGDVPGVCYGASTDGRIEPLPITVNVKALRAALDPVRKQNTVIELTIQSEGGKSRSLSALVKDYQLHATRREITHVDLLAVDPNKEVVADVPLEFVGKPAGAIDGGQIRIVIRELALKAKPADIPVKISVDVSPLDIGDVIHVSAITLPAGVTAVTGRDLAVVTCAAPEDDKVEATADGAAPDAAAAAAPAAGAKDAKAAAPAAGAKDAKAPAAGAKAAPAAKPAKK